MDTEIKVEISRKILIAESETSLVEKIWTEARSHGYNPFIAFSIADAKMRIRVESPDLLLLGWKLIDSPGAPFMRQLRARSETPRLPVIVLGKGNTEVECVRALEEGADDYVKRDVSIKELLARIKVILKQVPARNQLDPLSFHGLTMDLDKHRVIGYPDDDAIDIPLGPTSFRLLHFFLRAPEETHSREEILADIWKGIPVKIRIVDVYVRMLRSALARARLEVVIETISGRGYRLTVMKYPRRLSTSG